MHSRLYLRPSSTPFRSISTASLYPLDLHHPLGIALSLAPRCIADIVSQFRSSFGCPGADSRSLQNAVLPKRRYHPSLGRTNGILAYRKTTWLIPPDYPLTFAGTTLSRISKSLCAAFRTSPVQQQSPRLSRTVVAIESEKCRNGLDLRIPSPRFSLREQPLECVVGILSPAYVPFTPISSPLLSLTFSSRLFADFRCDHALDCFDPRQSSIKGPETPAIVLSTSKAAASPFEIFDFAPQTASTPPRLSPDSSWYCRWRK